MSRNYRTRERLLTVRESLLQNIHFNLLSENSIARVALLLSIPEEVGFGVLQGPEDLIDNNGTFGIRFSRSMDRFFAMTRIL